MSAESFKQNSLGWRIQLLRQQVGEWIEFKTSQLDGDGWDFTWLRSPLLWQVMRFLLWSLIAILLVWLVWQLWLFLRPYLRNWRKQQRVAKVSPPIVEPQLSTSQWIDRAQDYSKQRDFRQAIFCLYQGMLQNLSDRGVVSKLLSRTDGEYQQSLQKLNLAFFPACQLLLSTHQRLCFSSIEASQSMFEECWQAYREINVE